MENVKLVKNVKNGEELFSNIKAKNEETLLNRIGRKLKASFSHKNNHGNYVFNTKRIGESYKSFEIYIVK